ncbi:MAG TPA: twin-arginine translocation signal domain-containing protein [Jatrophihabitans sp.]|nr:twin-arginine translocation signal domain-containing protein [Jatrophihabitans sp.]
MQEFEQQPFRARPAGMERRQFLRLAGAAGAGLLGASTLVRPTQAWAETMDAITLGDRINQLALAYHGPNYNWAENCQAAQFWAERAAGLSDSQVQTYSTAIAAYHASAIVSKDMSTAPAGSFSYYNASSAGHVVTNIGNGYCINTSPQSDGTHYYDFGHGLYISRLADYKVGPYLGWSHKNGVNPQIPVQTWSPNGSGGGSTWAWNAPDAATQKRIQQDLTNRNRYSGPIDGAWGVNSIKGIQLTCANVGYTGPIDGVPGPNTCHYVQVYAKKFGSYSGPVDSVLGPNSWVGFALGLERP